MLDADFAVVLAAVGGSDIAGFGNLLPQRPAADFEPSGEIAIEIKARDCGDLIWQSDIQISVSLWKLHGAGLVPILIADAALG